MFALIKYLIRKIKNTSPETESVAITAPKSTDTVSSVTELLRGLAIKGPSSVAVPKSGSLPTPSVYTTLDTDTKRYLRKLKINDRRREALEARLLALNFLSQQSEDLSAFSDSFVSHLQGLLLSERRRGAKAVRRVLRKKRK